MIISVHLVYFKTSIGGAIKPLHIRIYTFSHGRSNERYEILD